MQTVRQIPSISEYELERELGGDWATHVWLAREKGTGAPCALKLIDLGALGNPAIGNALDRETGMVAALSHDNVIQVYSAGTEGRHFYVAMELLEGGDLKERIGKGMPVIEALSVAKRVADALHHAHGHGVVHRNLRPSNVLFDRDGRPVLSDFGLSRIIERDARATRPQSAIYLPFYVAPEQIRGQGATTGTDIYALGTVLYEMLAGRPPFHGESPKDVKSAHLNDEPPALPHEHGELASLVLRMLSKSPNERPETARAVADELERIVSELSEDTIADRTVKATGNETAAHTGRPTVAKPTKRIGRRPDSSIGETWSQEGKPEELQTIGVGSLVRNRFRIEAILGQGGMGTVYYALDLIKQEAGDDEPYVALKVLHPKIASAELTFMALQREAKRAQELAHPNIVTVFDLDRVDGVVYMTMEILRGEDSEQLVLKRGKGLEVDEARRIVKEVTAGLAYAHTRGITHADLKPQNVFIAEDGRVKLLDFGIARAHRAHKPDQIEEMFSGYTPAYASPEILSGEKAMPADDIYALGCIAYFYFTGRHPFNRLSAKEAQEQGLKPKRPKSMRRPEWKAVSAALSFDGAKRPKDATEFAKRFAPSRVKQVAIAFSLLSVTVAVVLGLILGDRGGPEVPFDELPLSTQARINQNLSDAQMFMESGDINAALQLYDAVLRAHPGNERGSAGMEAAVDQVLEGVRESVRQGEMTPEDAYATLDTLLSYKTLPEGVRNDIKQTRSNI